MNSSQNKFWKEFIELYRDHEELWRVGTEGNKSLRMRKIGHAALLEKYREIEPDATILDLKKKISGLRTCFKRELNKVLQSKASGAEGDDLYVPTLWYFEDLLFLASQGIEKGKTDFEPDYLDETNDTVELSPSHNSDEHEKTKLQAKRHYSNYEEIDEGSDVTHPQTIDGDPDYADDFTDDFIEVPAKKRQKRDDADIFSESWAVLFRKCSPEQQIYAKRTIEEILLLGQLKKLSFKPYRFEK